MFDKLPNAMLILQKQYTTQVELCLTLLNISSKQITVGAVAECSKDCVGTIHALPETKQQLSYLTWL